MCLLWRELRQPHQRTTNLRVAQVHKQDADEHQGAVRVSGAVVSGVVSKRVRMSRHMKATLWL